MQLSNKNGDFVELAIAGYQFPENSSDQWDSNWLNIAGKVSLDGRTWTFLDPCLLTWEVDRLANWLFKKSTGEKVNSNIGFVEPVLELDCSINHSIQVFFELEARPEWAPCDGAGMMDLYFEMTNDFDQFKSASKDLEEQLARFPIRGEPLATY